MGTGEAGAGHFLHRQKTHWYLDNFSKPLSFEG